MRAGRTFDLPLIAYCHISHQIMKGGVSLAEIFFGSHIKSMDGVMAFKHDEVEAKGMEDLEGSPKSRSLAMTQLLIVSSDHV